MNSSHDNWTPSRELLAAYFDGECEGRDELTQLKQRIESWLARNPESAALLSDFRRLHLVWQDTSPAEPAPARWQNVLEKVQTRSRCAAESGRKWRLAGWISVAAAVVALVAGYLVREPRSPSEPQPPVQVALAVSSEDDEIFPVADSRDVTVVRVEGADTQTVVVGELPLQGPLELAAPGDVIISSIRPDASDNMLPHVRINTNSAPLIWARLESEKE